MKSILHSHRISNFQQNQVFHPNPNATTFNGTMTVTTERGTTENVPGFFQFQNNQMSIWVNPGDIENHFGPTPIQGMIINPELLQGIASVLPTSLQPGVQQDSSSTNSG
jgi:hypothetical protein